MALDQDDIKALIAILQKGLESQESTEDTTTVRIPKKRQQKQTKSKTIPKALNKFENMPEFNMCKEDLAFDKKVIKPAPSARLRDYEPIKVKCRVCGKSEKVAASLVESIERYKCNKCSTGAG